MRAEYRRFHPAADLDVGLVATTTPELAGMGPAIVAWPAPATG